MKVDHRLTQIMGFPFSYLIGGNRKCSKQSTNADQNSLETVFLFAICRQSGDKWQSKTLFLTIFYLHSSILLTFSIVAYPGGLFTCCCSNCVCGFRVWFWFCDVVHYALSSLAIREMVAMVL